MMLMGRRSSALEVRECRLQHASRLAQVAFAEKEEEVVSSVSAATRSSCEEQKVSPSKNKLYTASLEQRLCLARRLQLGALRIGRVVSRTEFGLMSAVLGEVRLAVGDDYGGCRFRAVAGLLNPGAETISFVAESHPYLEGSRVGERVGAGSPEFECLREAKTVVLRDRVFVPLRTTFGRPIGVLVLSGFNLSALPLRSSANEKENDDNEDEETKRKRWKTFLLDEKKKRMPTVDLWRRSTSEKTKVVKGRVVENVKTFSVRWEDGHLDREVSRRAIKDIVHSTPQSLGVGIPLDETALAFADYVASFIGNGVVNIRREKAVEEISRANASKTVGIFERALTLCLANILEASLVEIWEYDNEILTIVAKHQREWKHFRQTLTIRRLLEIPSSQRFQFWDKVKDGQVFAMVENILVAPLSNNLLLTVTTSKKNDDDRTFLNDLSPVVSEALQKTRLREKRADQRAKALQAIMNHDNHETMVALLGESCLSPGAHLTIGHLSEGGDAVAFDKGPPQSRDSIFFRCLPPTCLSSFVLRDPPLKEVFAKGLRVDIRYGKVWLPGILTSDCRHDSFDVTYDERDYMGRPQKERGVSTGRLRFPEPLKLPPFLKKPLVVVPLGKARGVLCVSEMSDEHDEPFLLRFLKQAADHIGRAIDRKKRRVAQVELSLATNTRGDLKRKLLRCLQETLAFPVSVRLFDLASEPKDIDKEILERCRASVINYDAAQPIRVEKRALPGGGVLLIAVFEDTRFVPQDVGKNAYLGLSCALKYDANVEDEMDFMSTLAEITQQNLAFIYERTERHAVRRGLLRDLRLMAPDDALASLLKAAVARLSTEIFPGSRVCLGLLLPGAAALRYSHGSSLVDKDRVVRRSDCLPCFRAMDEEAADDFCAPLIRCSGTVRGCLSVDGLDDLMPEARAFLEEVAILLGTAIDSRSKGDALKALRRHNSAASIDDIYKAGLRCLRQQLISHRSIAIWHLQEEEEDHSRALCLILEIVSVVDAGAEEKEHDRISATVSLNGARVASAVARERVILPLKDADWMAASLRVAFCIDGQVIRSLEVGATELLHWRAPTRTFRLSQEATVTLSLDLASAEACLKEKAFQESEAEDSDSEKIYATALALSFSHAEDHNVTLCDESGRVLASLAAATDARWENLDVPLSGNANPFARKLEIQVRDRVDGTFRARGDLAGVPLIWLPEDPKNVDIELERYPAETTVDAHDPLLEDDANWLATVTLQRRPQEEARSHEESIVSARKKHVSIARIANHDLETEPHDEDLDLEALVAASHRTRAACVVDPVGERRLLVAPFDDLVLKVGDEIVGPSGGARFAVVAEADASLAVSPVDLRFAADVTRALGERIRFVRLRATRESVRQHTRQLIIERTRRCSDGESVSEVLDDALRVAEASLPGCCVYVGILQPAAKELVYVSCNRLSRMRGNRLHRGEGISFRCVGPFLDGKATGLTVSASDKDAQLLRIFDDANNKALPYICLPLVADNGSVVGVLGIDSTDKVAREEESEALEEGVMDFLQFLASTLALVVQSKLHATVMARCPMTAVTSNEALMRWTLAASCEIVLHLEICEIWSIAREDRSMRVVARLWPQHHQDYCRVDAAVIVAADPATLRRRAARDQLHMPAVLASAERLDDVARRHYLVPDSQSGDRAAIMTEIAAGKLLNAALYEARASTRIDDGPRRFVVPLAPSSERHPALVLVLGGQHITEVDFLTANVARHFRETFCDDLPLEAVEGDSPLVGGASHSPAPSSSYDIEDLREAPAPANPPASYFVAAD